MKKVLSLIILLIIFIGVLLIAGNNVYALDAFDALEISTNTNVKNEKNTTQEERLNHVTMVINIIVGIIAVLSLISFGVLYGISKRREENSLINNDINIYSIRK